MPNSENNEVSITIPDDFAGKRLDKVIADLFPDYSRSRLQLWLKDGHILLDGVTAQGKQKVDGAEVLTAHFPEEMSLDDVQPEPIELDIIYEDDHIIVVNKPVGMVVHPGVGNPSGTLQNGLLYHAPSLASVPRSGIVHRLDKDTSGLLVVAKTLKAHKLLVDQLQSRTVSRVYDAICFGRVTEGNRVIANIGRHGGDRKKMAVKQIGGKEAITNYLVEQNFRYHTHVRCKLETGRTHQIRVHMAHEGYPLVGDQVYGGRLRIPGDITDELAEFLRNFHRQALHAAQLGLIHPETQEPMQWEVEMPEDMDELLYLLEQDMGDEQTVDDDADLDDDDWNEDDYDVEVVYAE